MDMILREGAVTRKDRKARQHLELGLLQLWHAVPPVHPLVAHWSTELSPRLFGACACPSTET